MKHIEVNIKKLVPEAIIPRYAKDGDAGLDVIATSISENDMYIEYGIGLSFEIPKGYFADMRPRSSISNYDLILANSPGTVDSGYRGEVKFRFKKTKDGANAKYYNIGDKIGQMIVTPYPLVIFNEVSELETSSRGAGGFGSSGK